MAGAIDLFSGSKSITGANKFQVDKSPLNQLFEGIDDVIGKQAIGVGQDLLNFVVQFVQKIIGDLMNAIIGLPVELLNLLEPALVQSFQSVSKFFGNLLGFLGDLNPLSDLFTIEGAAQNFINGVLAETGLLPLLDEAGHLAQDVLRPLIDAISQGLGLPGGLNLASLQSGLFSVIGRIQQLIDAISNALGHSGLGFVVSDVQSFLQLFPGGNIVGQIDNALLNAFNLFGQQPLSGLPFIPASHVVNSNPQLLWNSGFDTSAAVSSNGGFTWDGTVGHTGVGSAKCAAHGVQCNMISSPIPVTLDETLNLSVWAQWSGLTTSGSSPAPIRMEALQYHAGAKVTSTAIVSEATPGASAGWTQLAGTFRVPSGVDTVYLSLIVDTTATGGSVWFDDASVYKAGQMMAGNTLHDAWENLLTALFGANSIEARFLDAVIPDITRALSSDLQGVIDVFHNVLGIPGSGHEVATLEAALLKIPGTLLAGPTAWDQALVSNLAIAFNGITAFENNIQATLTADVNFLESYAINYANYIEGAVIGWVQNFVPNVIRSFF